ncbi:MAG: LysR family transcriptional regulator [Alphaproteobacteria bacterium]|nr:MAG: LysR family transcriptional regulator [Alphaproteobacteria bacterium]
MRLDWLEDILAVIDTGSIRAAAERRCVTQPAFSRRIRAIEESLGVELFDRSRKPVVPSPVIAAREEELRRTAAQLRDLGGELRRAARESHGRLVLATQHALTATLAPQLIDRLLGGIDLVVRLRSANREDCLALLMTRQADLMIGYQTEAEASGAAGEFLERAELGQDALIPVFAAAGRHRLKEFFERGELPIIAYPRDAFLGRVLLDDIEPRLPARIAVRGRVETALTLASLELAKKGIGVAWLPESVARPALNDGALADLRPDLPATTLRIAALRLRLPQSERHQRLWSALRGDGAEPGGMLRTGLAG